MLQRSLNFLQHWATNPEEFWEIILVCLPVQCQASTQTMKPFLYLEDKMHNLLIQKYVLSQNTYQIKVKNFVEVWFLFFYTNCPATSRSAKTPQTIIFKGENTSHMISATISYIFIFETTMDDALITKEQARSHQTPVQVSWLKSSCTEGKNANSPALKS